MWYMGKQIGPDQTLTRFPLFVYRKSYLNLNKSEIYHQTERKCITRMGNFIHLKWVNIMLFYTPLSKNNLLWLSLGSNQYWAGRVYNFCVYLLREHPMAQPKVVLEKPGIVPAIAGLQAEHLSITQWQFLHY